LELAVKELSKKICLLGTFAVGKTSLVQRFTYNRFDERYISTLGVKVSQKSLQLQSGETIAKLNMMIWDIDGRSEWNSVRSSYLRGASGALLVCDMTRAHTLEELNDFVTAFRNGCLENNLVLVANKSDLTADLQITTSQLNEFASSLSAPLVMSSAKTGDGVEEAFRHLGQLMIHE